MKKIFLVTLILLIIFIGVINNRTPFYYYKGGGWSIGFASSEGFPTNIDFNKKNIFSVYNLKKISDSTAFIADPFFINHRDTFYLFFEHAKYKQKGADIALMTSVDGKEFKFRGIVLDEKFHLSYPNVFRYKNNFYMIPETKRANNIFLYESQNFPFNWVIRDTLVKNVRLKDPTIYLSDSLNILVASDDNYTLYMYESDSLFGTWKKHKRSKILMGSESRPGGRFFVSENNELVLPVQNTTEGYGTGISLYEIKFDNKNEYKVNKLKNLFLKANPKIKEFNKGMHHFDIQKINAGYFYVYDGNTKVSKRKVFHWKQPLELTYYDIKNWLFQKSN